MTVQPILEAIPEDSTLQASMTESFLLDLVTVSLSFQHRRPDIYAVRPNDKAPTTVAIPRPQAVEESSNNSNSKQAKVGWKLDVAGFSFLRFL